MFTLFGPEAVDGDYVICEHHEYSSVSRKCSSPQFIPAIVRGQKAYAPYITSDSSGGHRWVRKETAIIKISQKVALDYFKKQVGRRASSEQSINFIEEVMMNMDAKRVKDIPGSLLNHLNV